MKCIWDLLSASSMGEVQASRAFGIGSDASVLTAKQRAAQTGRLLNARGEYPCLLPEPELRRFQAG